MIPLVLFLASLAASLIGVGMVRKVALRYRIGALPSARKVHRCFTPVLGGLGIFLGLLTGTFLIYLLHLLPQNIWSAHAHFWGGLLIVLLTGFVDDLRGLTASQKFLGQFLAAAVAVFGGCQIEAFFGPGGDTLPLGWFSYPFSILWIMFVINAVNLLDGLDGLAGGISVIVLMGFLVITWMGGNLFLSLVALTLIGALLGFLKYNKHPASIFMGDVGSLMLGYILAFFSVEALRIAGSGQVYFLASLVFLGMPVTDTLISFFRRMGRGEHPFRADREHIHHRLLNLGLTHKQTVEFLYLLTVVYTVLAVFMVIYRELVGALLFSVAFAFSIFWAWRLGYLETRRIISFGPDEQETLANIRPRININRVWHQVLIFTGDALGVCLALYLTIWFRFQSGVLNPPTIKSVTDYLAAPVFLLFCGIWLLLFWLNGLYNMPWDVSRFYKSLRVARVVTFGILCLLILLNLDILMNARDDLAYGHILSESPRGVLNRAQVITLGFYWLMMILCINGIRLLIIEFEKRYHRFEYTYKNTLLIGTTRKARNILRDIRSNPHLLYRVVGVVDRKPAAQTFEGIPVLGSYADLPELIREHRIEEIIVAINESARADLLNIIGVCDRLQVVVKTLPELQAIVSGRTPGLGGHTLVRVFPENMVLWQWVVKRLIDIGMSVVAMVGLMPLWLPLAVLIRMRFRKGVFVKVPILGRNGRIFNMYLFRIGKPNRLADTIYQGYHIPKKLTPLGQFLVRTQLYKLPQFFNVLRGDMSIVGPRPEPPEWYRKHQHRLRFLHRRLMVRPGLTGIAQIRYRYDISQKSLAERLKYDIYYVEHISLSLDFSIMLRSLVLLLWRLWRRGKRAA
ncbi:MAG: hypothetical protein D6681_13295 [Calditrichaeota bacterium]|nr:MAG: hypothetical protein D6681_13295 [Calditrichota bacterium]